MSSKYGHTLSSRPVQSTPYNSPLIAHSSHSVPSHTTPLASNSIFTNRLIPRDYLTSRANPFPNSSTTASDEAPLESSSVATNRNVRHDLGSGNGNFVDHPLDSTRQKSGSVSDKENAQNIYSLNLQRTRSLESAATSASSDSIAASTSASSKPTTGSSTRTLTTNMPRTSSLDSVTTTLSASSGPRKEQGDTRELSPASIRNLISTAGSAESVIVHLLKEKNSAASQNNQLWTLVEKQRTLLLGLNKDLERVTKDRDKYRKRLKELQAQSPLPNDAEQSPREGPMAAHSNAVKPPGDLRTSSRTQPLPGTPSIESTSPIEELESTMLAIESELSPGIIVSSSSHHADRLALQAQTTGLPQSAHILNEVTPLSEKPAKGFSALRKTAPKPLNLLHKSANDAGSQPLLNQADRALLSDEDDQRGRRKTREEDDQDRERSQKQEQEARSKSKKVTSTPPESESRIDEVPPSIVTTLPVTSNPQGMTPGSALAVPQALSFHDRLIPLPLRSPGLPSSPRPINNNFLSAQQPSAGLPLSPRAPPPGPLSPRAPKQAIPPPMMSPNPFTDPALIQRQNLIARQAAQQGYQPQDRLQVHEPAASSDTPPVYQGLVSPQYPNLLLPPNALPSIQVQVASSRLRPSRHSMLGLRTQDDSTVFSLSVFSRASRNELWRIEKIPATLPLLEQQLRPRCRDLPRMPDRKLFTGHSPVVIDARREAVNGYFEELLDMEMDEPSALFICRFLSTDVLDPSSEPPKQPGINPDSLPQPTNMNGRVVKTGFLTKKGKNFGGWKSRYFVLDTPELRYYDTPGGPQIGSIRVNHAKIGSQRPEDNAGIDGDDQYRHAFLIQEPKKKDSTVYVRHILCAESDQDRDQWVSALLHYVDVDGQRDLESPTMSHNSGPVSRSTTSNAREMKIETHANTPSPTSPVSVTDISINGTTSRNANISAPINGVPIHDSSQWGNKSSGPQLREKSSKMEKIFHFKKASQEQLPQGLKNQDQVSKPRVLRHNGYIRAVFGLPLADAVEYCSPFNIDVQLPAVVYRCIEYLRFRNATNEEGLFRLSGSNIVVKTLKERFNQEGDIDLVDDDETYDVHAIASLFKTYFRELPSPLLTRELHLELLKVLERDSQTEKVVAFNILVHRLPRVNFELLRAMSEFLLEVTQNAGKNKMSVRNMGIVFSPTVNIPTPVFNLFLGEYTAIFERSPEDAQAFLSQAHSTDMPVAVDLSPVDIRSPRRQFFSEVPTPAYNQTAFDQNGRSEASVSHTASGSGEFGFIPLYPSYENGAYVTHPNVSQTSTYSPPLDVQQHSSDLIEDEEQFNSLNRIVMPAGVGNDKRRKRESMMLL